MFVGIVEPCVGHLLVGGLGCRLVVGLLGRRVFLHALLFVERLQHTDLGDAGNTRIKVSTVVTPHPRSFAVSCWWWVIGAVVSGADVRLRGNSGSLSDNLGGLLSLLLAGLGLSCPQLGRLLGRLCLCIVLRQFDDTL